MTTIELYLQAEKIAKIEYANLTENLSFCLKLKSSTYYIFIKNKLSESEERVCICHECGHINYAGLYSERTPFDTIDRIEYRARKYSYLKLMPLGKVREALKDPFCRTLPDIADRFGVTEEFAKSAMAYYRRYAGFED